MISPAHYDRMAGHHSDGRGILLRSSLLLSHSVLTVVAWVFELSPVHSIYSTNIGSVWGWGTLGRPLISDIFFQFTCQSLARPVSYCTIFSLVIFGSSLPAATLDLLLDIWNIDDHKVRPSFRRNGQAPKHFPCFSKMHLRRKISKDGDLC